MWESGNIGDGDVLVIGGGNLDLWTVYKLARRRFEHTAVWKGNRAFEACPRSKAKDLVVGLNQGIASQ